MGAVAVLQQADDMGADRPVCLFSKKFNSYQLNYSTIEKEALALIWAMHGAPCLLLLDRVKMIPPGSSRELGILVVLVHKKQGAQECKQTKTVPEVCLVMEQQNKRNSSRGSLSHWARQG